MNIQTFKEKDIIHRVEPSPRGDYSYMGLPVIFIGAKWGLIVVKRQEKAPWGEGLITLPMFDWLEGWDYYPQDLIEKSNNLEG